MLSIWTANCGSRAGVFHLAPEIPLSHSSKVQSKWTAISSIRISQTVCSSTIYSMRAYFAAFSLATNVFVTLLNRVLMCFTWLKGNCDWDVGRSLCMWLGYEYFPEPLCYLLGESGPPCTNTFVFMQFFFMKFSMSSSIMAFTWVLFSVYPRAMIFPGCSEAWNSFLTSILFFYLISLLRVSITNYDT